MSWFEEKIHPMLAVKGKPFDSDDFIYEIKWDGTRTLAFVDTERKLLKLQNRRLYNITYRYPELNFFESLSQNAILDGEIIVLKDGKPAFDLLQKREHIESRSRINLLSKMIPAVYFVFDVLYTKEDEWITDLPLIERRKILKEIVNETNYIVITDYVRRKGKKFYYAVVEKGLEGVMAKKLDSKYHPGKRSKDWIKCKKRETIDCIIVGYLEGEGEREGFFGSLILALKENNKFIHVGQVGTGFCKNFIEWFFKELKKIEIKFPWFDEAEFKRKVHWVKPKFVCEVEFLELTKDKKLRAPIFVRLRNDKNIDECTLDQLKL